MAALPNVKVGDPLILATANRYREDEPVTVSRIGRKYLYVARDGRELTDRFYRDTGVEDSNYGGKQRLYTPDQYDEVKQRDALFRELYDAGIEVAFRVRDNLTTDQLRALLAVVQPAA